MKKLLAFAILTFFLIGTLALTSCRFGKTEANASKGLTYQLNHMGDGYIVTGMGTCTDTKVVIPSTYEGLPVMSIAEGAFQATKPPVENNPSDDGDKGKGDKDKKSAKSLFGMKLLSNTASLPNILTLADSASGNVQEKPEANITEIVIPDSVMDIGNAAFYGCEELASFEVSNLITLIGTDAFKNTAYYLDESNWTDGSLYLEEYLVEVRTTVSGAYTVREGTVNIASSAFAECTEITAVSFPKSLRFVGDSAFLGCSGISEVDLSVPGIQIGNSAFQSCTSLASVKIATDDIPNAPPLTEGLGQEGTRLDDVFMPGGKVLLAFDPTADPDLIYSASIRSYAFADCTALQSVTLGSNIGIVLNNAFAGCTALTSIDMSMLTACKPDTAVITPDLNYKTSLSLDRTFSGCTSLKEVKLPKGIEWLRGTFEGCTALTEFTVPDTVKGLNETFFGCTNLTDVTIPESVLALAYTFAGCESLTEIELPKTLLKIGNFTFNGCDSLTGVSVPDSVTEIGERVFPSSTENGFFNVSIGKGVKSIGRQAVCNDFAVVYRGTMAEWKKIDLHENWNRGEGTTDNGEPLFADIICADGTIVDGSTSAERMKGILLSDGTLYGRYLNVTVKLSANGQAKIVLKDLAAIEAELPSSGSEGWKHVTVEDILQKRDSQANCYYQIIRDSVQAYLENGQMESGGTPPEITPPEEPIRGILLSDGTFYVLAKGITIIVKDGAFDQSEIGFTALQKDLMESETKGWKYLSDKQIQDQCAQYGKKLYTDIIAFAENISK